MLTFFDYLRQRAYESVLTGAQEALDLLERQESHSEPKPTKSSLPAPDATNESPQTEVANTSAADDDLLPPPRRRGRPNKQPKGQS